MRCPNCGKKIPDDSIFCPECGERIKKRADQSSHSSGDGYEGHSERTGSRLPVILAVIALVLAAAVLFFVIRNFVSSPLKRSAVSTEVSSADMTQSVPAAAESASTENSSAASVSASAEPAGRSTDILDATLAPESSADSAPSTDSASQAADSSRKTGGSSAELTPLPSAGSGGTSAAGADTAGVTGTAAGGTSVSADDYIIPDSSTRLITEADLNGMTPYETCLARNEIVARHGRLFKSTELQNYFNSKSWYNGTISPDDFDADFDTILNDVERKNEDTILAFEKTHGTYSPK